MPDRPRALTCGSALIGLSSSNRALTPSAASPSSASRLPRRSYLPTSLSKIGISTPSYPISRSSSKVASCSGPVTSGAHSIMFMPESRLRAHRWPSGDPRPDGRFGGDELCAARRHSGRRRHVLARRSHVHRDPRRPRRRRGEGRASRPRRRGTGLGAFVLRRGQRHVLRGEPLEALARARLQGRAGPGGAAAARRRRGRVRAVAARGDGGAARARQRCAACAQRQARLLLGSRVRSIGAARRRAGLRPADAGIRRADQHHRRAGPARCARRRLRRRPRHGSLGRARRSWRRCWSAPRPVVAAT